MLYAVQDDGTCGSFSNEADCAGSATDNVSVGSVGSSCGWDEDSRTCFLPEPDEDMETSLIVSTVSLVLSLPFELLLTVIFAAFIIKPTRPLSTAEAQAERCARVETLVGSSNDATRC